MFCARCHRETVAEPCSRCGEPPLLDGRYRLEEPLGEGASGTTWRARGPDGDQVAIKAIALAQTDSHKERELLEREVRVLRELHHPGIPAYIEHIVQGRGRDATLWLVQELVPGRSLADELVDHRFTPREVLAIIAELAGVLAYLHELSPPVIHRDVKPANVMRRPEGDLVLIDFGAVRDVAKGSLGGSTVAGTFGYMAPEQFAGDAEPRSDLYGLGALAVALLTRREPQTLADHANRLHWVKFAPSHEGIHDLVNRLVEPEIERRAPSAAWVQQRAELMLLGKQPQPSPLLPSARVEEVLQRKPRDWRWWSMALAALLTLAAIPVALTLERLPARPHIAPEPPLLAPGAPVPEPRQEHPPVARPGAGEGLAPAGDALQRIVETIGEDPAIQGCVARHQRSFPAEAVVLEVHLAPPDEIAAVEVGPPSLEDDDVIGCLERAAFAVRLPGVVLERSGSVTLAFD